MQFENEQDYLQEIEAEYLRIRGRRGLLKPLDWDLAAGWEKAGFPLPVVLRTMAEIGDRFYRENKDGDQINSLRYFDSAVRRAAADFQSRQVGKTETETRHLEMPEIERQLTLGKLEIEVGAVYLQQPKLSRQIGAITSAIRELKQSSADERTIENRLEQLDRELIELLKSTCVPAQIETFESAGTSSDQYLRRAQISAAIRHHFSAPELTLFPNL